MAENQVLTLARQYAAAVRSAMETKDIYLYGSQVEGTATQDSDIDIAVVVDRVPGDYLNTMALLWKLGRAVSHEIEPVLLSQDDTDSGFLQTVQRTGIAV